MGIYQNDSDTFYAYDDNGNITSITRGTTSIAYEYNGANELTRENNQFTDETVTYAYDLWGGHYCEILQSMSSLSAVLL